MQRKEGAYMAYITLKEYAERNHKHRSNALKKAREGEFETAKKFGNQWIIDENEPYIDRRIKSGKYIGFRKKYEKENQ